MSEGRPSASVADVTQILAQHYNLQVLSITELVSFDSRNFAVEAVPLKKKLHRKAEHDDEAENDSPSRQNSDCCGSKEKCNPLNYSSSTEACLENFEQ